MFVVLCKDAFFVKDLRGFKVTSESLNVGISSDVLCDCTKTRTCQPSIVFRTVPSSICPDAVVSTYGISVQLFLCRLTWLLQS